MQSPLSFILLQTDPQLQQTLTEPRDISFTEMFGYGSWISWVLLFETLLVLVASLLMMRRYLMATKGNPDKLHKEVTNALNTALGCNPRQSFTKAKEDAMHKIDFKEGAVYYHILWSEALTFFTSRIQSAQAREQDASSLRESLERRVELEYRKMTASFWYGTFAFVIKTATAFGLFGTLLGIMDIFQGITQSQGGLDLKNISGGMFEAIVTTLGGLFVMILTSFLNYFVQQNMKKYEIKLKTFAHEIIKYCTSPTKAQ
ncbi:MotA/TolQ/ExbB proton channel family protein [Hugenholtzia roseola]|uniref:MotA/TolQ/ExbB proton channel family protein n=1 Tax=Hugenholtzia roseola TaxID=1002 RepID=UPI00137794DD|nr:MotA/TolQ/ExbB proton channel family protein [Hugenholtzia roseola]